MTPSVFSPFLFGVVVAGALGLAQPACTVTSPAAGVTPSPANPGQPVASASAAAAQTPKPAAPPQTADGCRACNGVWGIHGLAQTESCVCRTTDGGKRCRDGADCQGMCIAAEQPEREIVQTGPPPRGFFVGRCSDLVTVFGCNRIIERGAAASGPVPLGEPPGALCVD